MPLSFDHPSPKDDRDFGRQLAAHDAIAQARMELAHVAAEADTLRAENARLRAALAEATATLEAWHVGNAGHMCADPGWRVAMQDETGRQLNRARAALDGAR